MKAICLPRARPSVDWFGFPHPSRLLGGIGREGRWVRRGFARPLALKRGKKRPP